MTAPSINGEPAYLTVPAYLKIVGVALASATDMAFRLTIGVDEVSARELVVSGAQFFVLSIADGTRTVAMTVRETKKEFDDVEEHELAAWIDELCLLGILCVVSSGSELLPNRQTRYARHELFFASLGKDPRAVQRRLRDASVAVIGVGGIGTWVSYLLAAAGVGRLVLVDGDVIEESNLTRQVLFRASDIGQRKVDVARRELLAVCADLECEVISTKIDDAATVDRVARDARFIVLSGAEPRALYDWVDDYSVRTLTPWIRAGYLHTRAICGPLLVPGRTGCQACVAPPAQPRTALPFVDEVNRRFQVPSFGPLNGIAAAMAADATIKWLGGFGEHEPTLGAAVVFESLSYATTKLELQRNPHCARCSHLWTEKGNSD